MLVHIIHFNKLDFWTCFITNVYLFYANHLERPLDACAQVTNGTNKGETLWKLGRSDLTYASLQNDFLCIISFPAQLQAQEVN